MEIEPADAADQREYRGGTYHFCSLKCKAKFDVDPDRYTIVMKTPAAAIQADDGHGDSHHRHRVDTSESSKPPSNAKYFCPMHSEIVADKPGECKKCGMALELNPA